MTAEPRGEAQGTPAPDLEPDAARMRELVELAMQRIVAHIGSLPRQPAADTVGAVELARRLVEGLPEAGTRYDELLDLLFDVAGPKSFNTAGPGYLAYVPGGGLFEAAVADLIAGSLNRYTGVFAAAPALSQLEANVLRWFAEIVGYPGQARGFLTSGGSLANLGALVTARREKLGERFQDGVLYLSSQVHHSVAKAAVLAGFAAENLRSVEVDERFRLRPEALAARITEDRRRGARPFLVVASAGTTNTGAVDPLPELADLAAAEGLWLHVDAAYGGFFCLTERGRATLAGIERADSVVLDPHKGLFLPYGTGALLVRDGEALRRAHSHRAEYLPPMQEDHELVDFCEISPELSKPFRGLRVWLPFKLHGVGPFRRALDEKLDLTRWIESELAAMPELEILASAQLSTLAFAVAAPGASLEEGNRLTERLHAAINARQRVHLTATRLGGRYAIRICVLSFRTHRDRMEVARDDIAAALGEVLGAAG